MSDNNSTSRRYFLKGASLAGIAPLALGLPDKPRLTLEPPGGPSINSQQPDASSPANRPLLLDPDNVPLNPTSTVVINNAGINFGLFRIAGDNDPNLFVIDSATDRVGIGTVAPNNRLHVNTSLQTIRDQESAIYSFLQLNPTADVGVEVRGAQFADMEIASGNPRNFTGVLSANFTRVFHRGTGTLTQARGLNMVARNMSTGTISLAYGGVFFVGNETGTITKAIAQYNNIANLGAGTITEGYCFYGANTVNVGTWTKSYGLLVEPLRGQTNYGIYIMNQNLGATANYAIYSEGGASVLKAGSPTVVPLMIQGAASQTAPLQEWRNDAGNLMAVLTAGGLLDVQGVSVQLYTASVSNPPTKAQLDSVFGSPATLGAGFIGLIDSNGAQTDVYLCVTTPTNWFYTKLTKAL